MRIFVAPDRLAAGELRISGDEHHYLARVRRARAGALLEILDGAGRRAAATIVAIEPTETVLAVGAQACAGKARRGKPRVPEGLLLVIERGAAIPEQIVIAGE